MVIFEFLAQLLSPELESTIYPKDILSHINNSKIFTDIDAEDMFESYDGNLCITKIIQKTKVIVDEFGADAVIEQESDKDIKTID